MQSRPASLYKIPLFHPRYWRGYFVETWDFRKVSGDSTESLRATCVSTKFPHQETRWNFSILFSTWFNKMTFAQTARTWYITFWKVFFSNTKNSFTRKTFVFTEGKAASLVNVLPSVKVVYSRIFFSDIWLLSLKVFFMGFYCSLDIRLPRIPKGLGTIWLGISTRLKFFFF